MEDRELYVATISDVADSYGGLETLARVLQVDLGDLCSWAEGKSRPPTEVFLRLVNMKESNKIVGRAKVVR